MICLYPSQQTESPDFLLWKIKNTHHLFYSFSLPLSPPINFCFTHKCVCMCLCVCYMPTLGFILSRRQFRKKTGQSCCLPIFPAGKDSYAGSFDLFQEDHLHFLVDCFLSIDLSTYGLCCEQRPQDFRSLLGFHYPASSHSTHQASVFQEFCEKCLVG